jgi:tetratricopeptide (TPR) repeat protein
MSLVAGETIGAYRIVQQLGSGGMATVYKAYHAALDRHVAIKVLHPAFTGDEGFLARFQREAQVVARLEHPNIVPVFDFSEHNGAPYLVMRFIEGETLKARIQRCQLSGLAILEIIRPVGAALSYAHAQGVLHRDIKPSNVLLGDDGQVFLTDFGLARIVQAGESSLTRDGMVGTPFYISPEQAMGKSDLDGRTDIYSFGVVLYELFTGRVPFQADTPFAVIHDHIYAPLPLPASINPDIPAQAERVLLRALAKSPDDRYASADELVAAVEAAVNEVSGTPTMERANASTPAAPALLRNYAAAGTLSKTSVASPEATAPVTAPDNSTLRRKRKGLFAVAGLAFIAVLTVALTLALSGERATREQTPPSSLGEQSGDGLLADAPVWAFVDRGNDLLANGDVDGALRLFHEAVRTHPQAYDAYLAIAHTLFEHGIFEPAITILRVGVDANPEHIELHLWLARALIGANQWDAAVGQLDWLITHVPEMAEPHAYLSVHLAVNVNDVGGAEHEANRALFLDPDSAEAHFAMGVFNWKSGDMRSARRELERAVEMPAASALLRQRVEPFLERLDRPEPNNP